LYLRNELRTTMNINTTTPTIMGRVYISMV
jgi:hypothetical protein